MNASLVSATVGILRALNVSDVVYCPGSFNSPILKHLHESQAFEIHSHYEERGAAFFAIGLTKATLRPVAVCVTSGTAVAECLPAVIEAYYSSAPLIIISADRPKRFQHTGAPQVIPQGGLLKDFCAATLDLDEGTENIAINNDSFPLHINLRFEEPLFGENRGLQKIPVKVCHEVISNFNSSPKSLPRQAYNFSKIVVVVGALLEGQRKLVLDSLSQLGAPVVLEALSGLQGNSELKHLEIRHLDQLLLNYIPEAIVRIGSVPTTSAWRDLERTSKLKDVSVLSFSTLSFPGLARSNSIFPVIEVGDFLNRFKIDQTFRNEIITANSNVNEKTDSLISRFPKSEPALVAWFSKNVPTGANLYLGNSDSIRQWDLLSKSSISRVFGNRGTNGIDGQLATLSGLLNSKRDTFALVGDLTALYDLSSLPLLASRSGKLILAVINNSGAGLFKRLPYAKKEFPESSQDLFLCSHKHRLTPYFEAAGFSTIQITDSAGRLELPNNDKVMLEIIPNAEQTSNFWDGLRS